MYVLGRMPLHTFFLADRLGEPSLVLILKWGGELTPAGRIQAEELGRIFRCMYPGGQGRHLSGSYLMFICLPCSLLSLLHNIEDYLYSGLSSVSGTLDSLVICLD